MLSENIGQSQSQIPLGALSIVSSNIRLPESESSIYCHLCHPEMEVPLRVQELGNTCSNQHVELYYTCYGIGDPHLTRALCSKGQTALVRPFGDLQQRAPGRGDQPGRSQWTVPARNDQRKA